MQTPETTDSDIWSYIRLLQAIMEHHGRIKPIPPAWYSPESPSDIEGELLSKCKYHAKELGYNLERLIAWLQVRTDRKPKTHNVAVGNERIPRL